MKFFFVNLKKQFCPVINYYPSTSLFMIWYLLPFQLTADYSAKDCTVFLA